MVGLIKVASGLAYSEGGGNLKHWRISVLYLQLSEQDFTTNASVNQSVFDASSQHT